MAVSLDASAFIVISRNCLGGCGFNSHCHPGSFLIFNSVSVMYSAVGLLSLSCFLDLSTWVQFALELHDLIV